ncbi:MAG: hypothetical protein ABJB66_11955 [Gemmatimonadaceae bacterium]
MNKCTTLATVAVFGIFQSVNAQSAIPTRNLGPIEATAADSTGKLISIRTLSNGKVLVCDAMQYQIKLFDSTLSTPKIVQQFSREQTSINLIPYRGDSTLYLDPSSRTFVLFDAEGRLVRVIALPRQQDAGYIMNSNVYGMQRSDQKGRIIYRAFSPLPQPVPTPKYRLNNSSETDPLIRGDFELRSVDTIAKLQTGSRPKMTVAEDASGMPIVTARVNPINRVDQWSMLSDGTIGIVRANDYHIDWIEPDDSRRSTAKMPFAWVRLSDADKQKRIDSIAATYPTSGFGKVTDTYVQTSAAGMPQKGKQFLTWLALADVPDYEPAIDPGAVTADLNNHLWILPRATGDVGDGGLLYDVVSRDGEIIERIRLPKGRQLLGFGPNNAVYLARVEKSGATFIERARLK